MKSVSRATRQFSKAIIIRSLPKEWEVQDIVGEFGGKEIEKVNFIKNKNGEKTGKVIVHYQFHHAATNAVKRYNAKEVMGQKVYLDLYKSEESQEKAIEDSFQANLNRRVYVQNISFEATQDDVYALLRSISNDVEIKMPINQDGTHRGFAIAYLNNPDHTSEFIKAFNKRELFGEELNVSMKLSPSEPSAKAQLPYQISFFSYLQQKYNSTLLDPGFSKIPSIKCVFSSLTSSNSDPKSRKHVLSPFLNPNSKKLETLAHLSQAVAHLSQTT